jgi:hypothetical protein
MGSGRCHSAPAVRSSSAEALPQWHWQGSHPDAVVFPCQYAAAVRSHRRWQGFHPYGGVYPCQLVCPRGRRWRASEILTG